MAKPNQSGVWNTPDRPGRPSPYGVQWRETRWDADSKSVRTSVRTEFFKRASDRDARAEELRRDRAAGNLQTVSRQEIAEWRAFQEVTKGTPWPDVVAGWKAWLLQSGLQQTVTTVEKAVQLMLEASKRLTETNPPSMSADTFRQKKHKLTLFAEQFGRLRLNEVNARDVEAWIDSLDQVESEATFNSYLKHIRVIFAAAVNAGELPRNPLDSIRLREDSHEEAGILTPQQAARLFEYARVTSKYTRVIGRLALEAFLGLRYSSGTRVDKKDINFKEHGILLPRLKVKTRTRHYVDKMPDQLWAWLAITPEECWTVKPRNYLRLKSDLFADANVPHPPNCFRHSFATYDLAAHKQPGRTATLLCHESERLLWRRYKGNATQSDGLLYQAITPSTARDIAEGSYRLSAAPVGAPQNGQAHSASPPTATNPTPPGHGAP